MPSLTRVAIGGAIAIAVLVGASTFLTRPGPGPGSPGSPGPSAAPTPDATAHSRRTPGPRPIGLATVGPYVPETLLPAPAGAPLPESLLGRTYVIEPVELKGTQELILTLRAAADPHCTALFETASTCFTLLWEPNYPLHQTDPGARGSARIADDQLVLSFDVIPEDAACQGSVATYRIEDGGNRLVGVDAPACTFSGFTAT